MNRALKADLPVMNEHKETLALIQDEANNICQTPQYHVYHRSETKRGFTSITIPARPSQTETQG